MHVTNTQFTKTDWERYATCYDSLLALRPYVAMLHEVVDTVLSLPSGTILDASCGTGNFERIFCESCIEAMWHITGIDTSVHMLERAREKCLKYPCIDFHSRDLNAPLPYHDSFYAQVVSINTLYAVADPKRTLGEFYRVLEPGGYLTLVTPKYGYENGYILKEHCGSTYPDTFWADAHNHPDREEILIREAISDESVVHDMITIAQHNRHIAHNASFHFFNQYELVQMLSSLGFSIKTISYTYAHQDIFITATKGV